jgi:hypothetical protein
VDRFEVEARNLIKPVGDQNKGQVARFVATRLREAHPAFTPKVVRLIAEVLQNHGIGDASPVPDEDEPEPKHDDEEIPPWEGDPF